MRRPLVTRLSIVVAILLLASGLGAQAQSNGAKPTVSKSGYMFLDFWFLGGYDYNPADAFNPSPKQAKNTKYYWKIVTRDANGSTSSPVWSYTTRD